MSSQQGVAIDNQLKVSGWDALEKGVYILQLKTEQQQYSLKVIKN